MLILFTISAFCIQRFSVCYLQCCLFARLFADTAILSMLFTMLLICSLVCRYGDSQYVIYNVACGEGRLAFFNVTKIDMETRTCMDPSRNNEMRHWQLVELILDGSKERGVE